MQPQPEAQPAQQFRVERHPGVVAGDHWCWTQVPQVNTDEPSARTVFDPDMLQTMTMKNIMSILQCGPEHRRHNHSGSWYTCRYCRRTMCRVCFLQWSTELKDRGVRLGWYNISEIKRQRGALQMTRRLVDARLCGQCCSKLWHEIGFATLCLRDGTRFPPLKKDRKSTRLNSSHT